MAKGDLLAEHCTVTMSPHALDSTVLIEHCTTRQHTLLFTYIAVDVKQYQQLDWKHRRGENEGNQG